MAGSQGEVQKPEDFLDYLLTEGKDVPCDTGSAGDMELQIPPWFDEEKCLRGQKFYRDNIFSIGSATLSGLVGVLAIPSILNVLIFTERSSTATTAYKRYLATIFHVVLWHDVKISQNSSTWKSLLMIRKRHLLTSQSACRHSVGSVSQKDLALTQWAFVGSVITLPHYFGIQSNNKDDLEAYVHLWRCLGYMLGIEDRFNICPDSYDDSSVIYKDILEKVYRPSVAKLDDKDFNRMVAAMTAGLAGLNPLMSHDTVMFFTRRVFGVKGYEYLESDYSHSGTSGDKDAATGCSEEYKKLGWFSRVSLYMAVMIHSYILNWTLGRMYYNLMKRIDLFMYKHLPYVAFIKFGLQNAFVDIRVDKYKEKDE